MEGKFVINRQGLTLAPEERLRNDKCLEVNINQIEGIEEFASLHKLLKFLYCLPFELNQNAPWLQLQLTEQFDVCYFHDPSLNRYLPHMDSNLTAEGDTGVKLTLIYNIGPGELIVTSKNDAKTTMAAGSLVALKSRKVEYGMKGS